MNSREYRDIIERIIRNAIHSRSDIKLKKGQVIEIASVIAKNIHARLYGANIDGVDSPLWSNGNEPNVDASEILKE